MIGFLLGVTLGLVCGVAAVAVHQTWWVGLVGLTLVACLVWLRRGAARLGFALGLGLPVLRAAVPKPEGDYLIPANVAGWALLLGTFAVLAVAIGTLARPSRAAEDRKDPPPPT